MPKSAYVPRMVYLQTMPKEDPLTAHHVVQKLTTYNQRIQRISTMSTEKVDDTVPMVTPYGALTCPLGVALNAPSQF